MHADHAFVIGGKHRVCQDYALSQNDRDGKSCFGIVSDGCSGSEDTDVGARIMARMAAQNMSALSGRNFSKVDQMLGRADQMRMQMGLRQRSLDATVLGVSGALVARSHSVVVNAFASGDGFLVRKGNSGLEVWEHVAGNEHPMYLSYRLDEMRERLVMEARGNNGRWVYTRIMGDEEADYCINKKFAMARLLPEEGGLRMSDGSIIGLSNQYIKTKRCDGCPDNMEGDVWAVFSDGVSSFTNDQNEKISAIDVITLLMDFKGMKGVFVERMMNGFLKRARQNGWSHHDDLSMAAICI